MTEKALTRKKGELKEAYYVEIISAQMIDRSVWKLFFHGFQNELRKKKELEMAPIFWELREKEYISVSVPIICCL